MLETLLFLSFINLLTMLPLFAAYRLAENLQEIPSKTLWETLVSESWLLCLAVVAGSTFLALKLWRQNNGEGPSRWPIFLNATAMLAIWVVPGFFRAPSWLQGTLIQTWTIGTSVLLLIASFPLPIRAIQRMLLDKRPRPPEIPKGL